MLVSMVVLLALRFRLEGMRMVVSVTDKDTARAVI